MNRLLSRSIGLTTRKSIPHSFITGQSAVSSTNSFSIAHPFALRSLLTPPAPCSSKPSLLTSNYSTLSKSFQTSVPHHAKIASIKVSSFESQRTPRFHFSQSNDSSQGPRFFDQRTQMSSHFVLREEEIVEVLNRFNLSYKSALSDSSYQVEWCPFCLKPHNFDRSNSYTFGIKRSTGQFHCFRCSIRGSWWDFKNLMFKNVPLTEFRAGSEFQAEVFSSLDDAEFYLYHNQLLEQKTCKPELRSITGKENLNDRFIDFETLVKYKVGIGKEEFVSPDGSTQKVPVVYFPMFKFNNAQKEGQTTSTSSEDEGLSNQDSHLDEDNQSEIGTTISTSTCKLVKCKIRGIGKNNKKYMRMMPAGSGSGIFGLNTVGADVKEIVITEGEFDAMAVYQATGMSAVSLPNGASSLPLDILSSFDRFNKIYLWLDNDEAGRSNRRKLAEKLGLKRTYIVSTDGEKDANDILRQDASRISKYLNESKTIPDQNILVFEDLKQNVLNRLLKSEENQGVRSRRFEFFNQTIKGLRKGELTVLTGPTGSGKTSFLSQLSLDFCEQDIPTLWGSFEIKNEILATNMLMQMSGEDLVRSQERFPYWSDRFNSLPLYFMNFFGSTGMDQIISTIDYAIYKFDIQHVIIDNLQFLMGTQARGISKFDMLDKAIEQFRDLATKRDIHLTVVIHPKKVDESEDLHISSVFGSAKATQEADNVVIIQSRDNYRVIDIKKNRYNGDVGKKGLIFDKSNKNFYELSTAEVSDIINKKPANDLISKKREQLKEKIAYELTTKTVSQSKPQPTTPSSTKSKRNNSEGSDNDDEGGNNNGSSSSSSSNGSSRSGNPTKSSAKSAKSSTQLEKEELEKKMKIEAEVEIALTTNYIVEEVEDVEGETNAEVIEQETGASKLVGETENSRDDQVKGKSEQIEEWDSDSFEPVDSVEAVYSRHRDIPPKDHSMKLEEIERKVPLKPWEQAKMHQQQKTKSTSIATQINLEEIAGQIFEYQVQERTPDNDILDRPKHKKNSQASAEDGVFEEILKHKHSQEGGAGFNQNFKKRKL